MIIYIHQKIVSALQISFKDDASFGISSSCQAR